MKKSRLFLLSILACCFVVASCRVDAAQEKKKLVVGTASGYAPYVSLNAKGEYEGFDIDVAHLLAERLHRKLVLQDLGSMTSLLVALQKKKIDTIIWAMSITVDRLQEMDMVYYHGPTVDNLPFLFWKEIPNGVKTIADLSKLSKARVCVEAGSSQDTVLRQYPSLQVRFLDKIVDGVMEIKYGKSLTTCIDHALLSRFLSKFPDLKVLYLPLPEDQHVLGNGICVHRDDRLLRAQIEKTIADLRSEGKIVELEKKWNIICEQPCPAL